MPGGRPTDYNEEIAAIICERLIAGESLRAICRDPGMPDKVTVLRWLTKHDQFRTQYTQARELQSEGEFDEIEDLAATATPETVNVVRLQVDTRKWVLARKSPKKYGDRVSQEITGSMNLNHKHITEVSDEELLAVIQESSGSGTA